MDNDGNLHHHTARDDVTPYGHQDMEKHHDENFLGSNPNAKEVREAEMDTSSDDDRQENTQNAADLYPADAVDAAETRTEPDIEERKQERNIRDTIHCCGVPNNLAKLYTAVDLVLSILLGDHRENKNSTHAAAAADAADTSVVHNNQYTGSDR